MLELEAQVVAAVPSCVANVPSLVVAQLAGSRTVSRPRYLLSVEEEETVRARLMEMVEKRAGIFERQELHEIRGLSSTDREVHEDCGGCGGLRAQDRAPGDDYGVHGTRRSRRRQFAPLGRSSHL